MEGKPLHRSACLNHTQQSSPDLTPRECWLGTFSNCHAQKITNATNRSLGASAFQGGKCSAESWDFSRGGGEKPKQLCKQSHPTNVLAARLMQMRIKCLLSSDTEPVLQITNIKALPISGLSAPITESSQNAVLLSPRQPLKEAALPACTDWEVLCRTCPQLLLQCCLLALPRWHLLKGMGIAQIKPSPMHTHTPAQLFPQPKALPSGHGSPHRTTTNQGLSSPQGRNSSENRRKSPGLAARQRRLLKLVAER